MTFTDTLQLAQCMVGMYRVRSYIAHDKGQAGGAPPKGPLLLPLLLLLLQDVAVQVLEAGLQSLGHPVTRVRALQPLTGVWCLCPAQAPLCKGR